MFKSRSTEQEFLRSRADDLTRGMSLFSAICGLMLILDHCAANDWKDKFRSSSQGDAVEQRRVWLSLGAGVLCLVTFAFYRAAHYSACVRARACEVVAALHTIAILLLLPLFSRFYLAKVIGYDPYDIYPDVHFDDTTLLLVMDAIITAGHLMVPIRWSSLAAPEVSGVLTYTACAVSGTPSVLTSRHNVVALALLVLMAAVGKRALEYHERQAFLKVIEEKRLRAQTEFQLSQLGGTLASVNEIGLASASPNESATAQTAQKDGTTSEVSFNLSESLSAASGPAQHHPSWKTREAGVQATDPPIERADCSTETPVVWWSDSSRTGQSAKPPRPSPPPPPEVLAAQFCRSCRKRRCGPRCARSDTDSSASSSAGSTGASSGTAVNPNFVLTPLRTKQTALVLLMWQCNIMVMPGDCCEYHAAVQDLYTTIKILRGSPCQGRPWEAADSQCPRCHLLTDLDEVTLLCDFCTGLLADSEEGDDTLSV